MEIYSKILTTGILFEMLLLSTYIETTYGFASEIFGVTVNCSADTISCGPAPSCCAPGLTCNYRRGIPICENTTLHYISGFDNEPCADPYLFRCDVELGIPGFCCPIGTSCFTEGDNNVIHCVNALGTTAPAIPSATTGLVPSATPVVGSDPDIIYNPSHAWNASVAPSCAQSSSLQVTNTINATIEFNYTGPSLMVRSISSPDGGVFSVVVDGFNTTSTVDTYSGPGGLSLPACYPMQFPPFVVTPPGYQNVTNHTMTLVYIGISPSAPEGTETSIGQFDSFAIPDLQSILVATNNHGPVGLQNSNFYLLFVGLTFSLLLM